MNNEEAADVCKLLVQRGFGQELDKIKRPPFPSPFTTSGDDIAFEALRELDKSVELLLRFIPLHHASFTCPISFASVGGFVIGAGHESVACFTSIPSPEGERKLLDDFCTPSACNEGRVYEVGAGDAVASVITMFNTLGSQAFIRDQLRGRKLEDPRFTDLAGALFVSIISRIAGCVLVHTQQTCWSNLNGEKISRLLDEVADASLEVARNIVKKLYAPVMGQVNKWGIKVVAWRPGTVSITLLSEC